MKYLLSAFLLNIIFSQSLYTDFYTTFDNGTYKLNCYYAYNIVKREGARKENRTVTIYMSLKDNRKTIYKDSLNYSFLNSRIKHGSQIVDKRVLQIPYRPLDISIHVTENGESLSQVEKKLDVAFSENFLMSLPLLAKSFQAYTKDIKFLSKKFISDGLYIEPNFTNEYIIGKSNTLFLYFELLGLTPNSNLDIHYAFFNEQGKKVKEKEHVYREVEGRHIELLKYNVIAKLKSGRYRCLISVNNGKKNIEKSVFFSVVKSKSKRTVLVDIGFDIADEIYVLKTLNPNTDIKSIFDNLHRDKDKQKLINKLWLQIGRNSVNQANRQRQALKQNLLYIKEKFQNYQLKRYKFLTSDMGYLIIKYGLPDQVEEFQTTNDTQGYMRWDYFYLENGAKFYLADLNNFGKMELINSTHSKELRNPNWEKLLSRNKIFNGNQIIKN